MSSKDGKLAPPPSPGAPASTPAPGELTPLLSNKPSSTTSSSTAASTMPAANISSPAPAKTPAKSSTPLASPPLPVLTTKGIRKADTTYTWGTPAGLHVRADNDESLIIFRRAVGINSDIGRAGNGKPSLATAELGRSPPTGIYKSVIDEQRRKTWSHFLVAALIYAAHLGQIVIGAVLTALGPEAGRHITSITALGAANTVIAGILALLKGQGLPERLRKDEYEFRALQDWIEETESLLSVGVIGRNREEVGTLVEVAFRKYNAAKASEENNKPDNYVRQEAERQDVQDSRDGSRNRWSGRRRSE